MRPVVRGDAPKVYRKYGDAIGDLEERLGIYCSYCERRLPASLAVEHVSPKSIDSNRELDWTNFLLGCTNCNSVKLDKPTNDDDFLWPDRDNTLRAFVYSLGGFVELSASLSPEIRPMAEALMNIVGLNRHQKQGWPNPAPRDKRWKQREEVWKLAERCRDEYLVAIGRNEAVFSLITEAAVGYGFFSVWMTVFEGDSDLSVKFISAFSGTADCFDASGAAINRLGGKI